MSYLGKISALVTVNTGDFAPKLSAAAREVATFARSVEKNIGSTMRDAASSLNAIYTPLQRFERSLQAATSMKLSFNGFAGAIKDLDQLKMRLTSLNQRQIDVILKTSGFKDITAFRDAVGGLKSREFDLIARVGGVEKLKQLKDAIASSSGEFAVTAQVKDAGDRVSALRAQISELRAAGKSATLVVDASRVEAAKTTLEQARKALSDFTIAQSGGRGITAKALRQEFIGRRAVAEDERVGLETKQQQREDALRGVPEGSRRRQISKDRPDQSSDIRAKKAEIDELSKLIAQLGRLQKDFSRATVGLDAAETGARPNNRSAIKEKSKELRQQTAEYQKTLAEARQKINTALGLDLSAADVEGLVKGGKSSFDGLIANAEKLEDALRRAGVSGSESGAIIKRVMTALGESDAAAAVTQMRRLVSAAEEIQKPLAAAKDQLMAAGRGVEAAFLPALARSQEATEELVTSIKDTAGTATQLRGVEDAFNRIEKEVRADIAAINLLSEASAKAVRLRTGRELQFSNPRLAGALDRGAQIGEAAAALPASAIQANPRIASGLVEINRLSDEAVTLFARIQAKSRLGETSGVAADTRRLTLLLNTLREVQRQAETDITLNLNTENARAEADQFLRSLQAARENAEFVITGRPQTFEQARGRQSSMEGEISTLDRSQRQNFAGMLRRASELSQGRSTEDLDRYLEVLDQIDAELRRTKRQNVDFSQAQDEAEKLRATLADIAKPLVPSAGIDRLRESAKSAADAVEKVGNAAERARLQAANVRIAGQIARIGNLPPDQQAARAETLARRAGVITGRADAIAGREERDRESQAAMDRRATALNTAWAQSIRGLPETSDQVDAFFTRVLGDVGRLEAATRVSFDPMIREIRDLVLSGDSMSLLTQRLLEFDDAAKRVSTAESLAGRIRNLSPSARRNELLETAGLAAASATSPIPLAEPPDTDAMAREVSAREAMGRDIEDPVRRMSQLQGTVASLKGQIEQLPDPMQAQFIPALRAAENEVARLSSLTNPVPEDIARAAAAARRLGADIRGASAAAEFLRSAGGAGAEGILAGINTRALRGYVAELEIVQTEMGRTQNASRRMAAAMAAENFRQTVESVRSDNLLGTREGDARIEAARREVATAVTGGGRRGGRLLDRMRRAGDVSRGGVDNFSLALNQAAFAIDDFMSSTGGLEFKLRAISNNITQMAFILGGTTGLFVGLGAVIGGQVAVGLLKWINNGKGAEDQTKALNDALSKQKSLVEELAQAYKAIGEATLRGTFANAAEGPLGLERQRSDLRRTSRSLSREARAGADAADLAPVTVDRLFGGLFESIDRRREFRGVSQERAEQSALSERISKSTNVGERALLELELRQSKDRERAALSRMEAGPAPSTDAVRASMANSIRESQSSDGLAQRAFSSVVTASLSALTGVDAARSSANRRADLATRDAMSQVPEGDTIAAMEGRVLALRKAQEARREQAKQADLGFIPTAAANAANAAVADYEGQIRALQAAIDAKLLAAADAVYLSLEQTARGIRAAQADVTAAIEKGVITAAPLQSLLNTLAIDLATAQADLEAASSAVAAGDNSGDNATARQEAIDRARDRVDAVSARQREVEEQARVARLGRALGGERTRAALSSMEGNQRFDNQQAAGTARLRDTISAEEAARRRAAEARNAETAIANELSKAQQERARIISLGKADPRLAELDNEIASLTERMGRAQQDSAAANAAEEVAVRLSEAAAVIAEFRVAVERSVADLRSVADSAAQRAETGANEARQAVFEDPFRAGVAEARDNAQRRLIDTRAAVEKAQNAISTARDEAMSDPRMAAIQEERARIDDEFRKRSAAVAAKKAPPETPADAEARKNRLVELDRQQEQIIQQVMAARRRELDVLVAGVTAREKELAKARKRDAEDLSLDRQRRQVDSAVAAADQLAEDAQQRFMANPTDENFARRNTAESGARQARFGAQVLQDRLDRRREEIEATDPAVIAARKELVAIDEKRAEIRDKAAKAGRLPNVAERTQLSMLDEEDARQRAIIEGRKSELSKPEQDAVDRFKRDQTLLAQAERGRLLGLTDRERFREEMEQGAGADIRARAAQMKKDGAAQADIDKFMNRAIAEQAKTIAPMIEEMRMERENAMLQGPSRAALNVSDVTTTQGQAELNRLLRGDDPAKDVNLAELRKQSDFLQILIETVKNNPLPVMDN